MDGNLNCLQFHISKREVTSINVLFVSIFSLSLFNPLEIFVFPPLRLTVVFVDYVNAGTYLCPFFLLFYVSLSTWFGLLFLARRDKEEGNRDGERDGREWTRENDRSMVGGYRWMTFWSHGSLKPLSTTTYNLKIIVIKLELGFRVTKNTTHLDSTWVDGSSNRITNRERISIFTDESSATLQRWCPIVTIIPV